MNWIPILACKLGWHEPTERLARRYDEKGIAAVCRWCGCFCARDKSLGTWRRVE